MTHFPNLTRAFALLGSFRTKARRRYQVCIDDNYHHMDGSARYVDGSYNSLAEAIERCQELTIKSLEDHYEKGITPEKLSAQWAMFGEDPYIVGAAGSVPFSARKFISTELCRDIIDSIESVVAEPGA